MSNILELLQNHGINPIKVGNKSGGQYNSPCPSCGGEDRFIVWVGDNEGTGAYRCNQCGRWGDNIQFLIDFEGMSFVKARRALGLGELDQDASISRFRTQKPKPTWQPESKDHPAEVVDLTLWREKAEKFVDRCHVALLEKQTTLDWLAGRGISLTSVKKFRIGWHVDDAKSLYRPRESWGLSGGINPKTKRPQMLYCPAGVVVPYFVDGVLHRVQVRLAKPDPKFPKKKYHNIVGSAMDTFLTSRKAKCFCVVETSLDAIMLDEQASDLIGAAAVLSSGAKPTARAVECFAKAHRVLNALDYDKAGSKARLWWDANITNNHRHPVSKGGDPGEAYQLGVDIRQWLWVGLPASMKIDSNGELADTPPPHPQMTRPAPEEPVASKQVEKQETKPSPHDDLPPEIARMADLLQRCPVVIQHTEHICGIRKAVHFDHQKHWQLQGEISELLFTTAVQGYLALHPAKMINAANFLEVN